MTIDCFKMGFGNGVDFQCPKSIASGWGLENGADFLSKPIASGWGLGNGVDFLLKLIASGWGLEMVLISCQCPKSVASGWGLEIGVDFLSKSIASGWGLEVVLNSCQQSRIKNGGLRQVLSTRGGRWCSRQCRKMVSLTVGNTKPSKVSVPVRTGEICICFCSCP